MYNLFQLILQVLTLRLFWAFWGVVSVVSSIMTSLYFMRGGDHKCQ